MSNGKLTTKREISIKWKMFAILLVFIVAVIAIIWIFQVGMLEDFYRNAKFKELHNTADKIEDAVNNSLDTESVVYKATQEYYSSIIVFEVKDRVAHPIIEAIQPANSIMPYFSKRAMFLSLLNSGTQSAVVFRFNKPRSSAFLIHSSS